ncbi:hypothetical protein FA13DRAFT_1698117 [Coprinellus micaceus]|uniref:Uncharacterized protein n=1 Tax=Coprinellus micaceus TaxID=71717 RepID=A0A4Y7SC31_COPMI|nr:hypothetical protein FA13DRAFT_1698117 [Coprinellus micaceus]
MGQGPQIESSETGPGKFNLPETMRVPGTPPVTPKRAHPVPSPSPPPATPKSPPHHHVTPQPSPPKRRSVPPAALVGKPHAGKKKRAQVAGLTEATNAGGIAPGGRRASGRTKKQVDHGGIKLLAGGQRSPQGRKHLYVYEGGDENHLIAEPPSKRRRGE